MTDEKTSQTLPVNRETDVVDVCRPESWAGEVRVNLIRLIAIVLFYGRHLAEYALAQPDAPVRGRYHLAVTVIALAWAFEAIVLHAWLARRQYAPFIKYAASLWDAVMITLLCVVAITNDPKTPLILLYFPLIAMSPLRWSLRLVYVTTAAAMLGYLFTLGYYAWHVIGYRTYYATPALRIPRSTEGVVLLSLLVCGLVAGQVVRQVRRMMQRHVTLVSETSEGEGAAR